MAGMTVDKRELLAASLHNQFLLAPAPRARVVSSLCGLQAQFANYPRHALRIRASDHDHDSWNKGLVKTWTFRGTLHLVPERELGLYLSALDAPQKWDDAWGIARRSKPRLAAMLLDWIRDGVREREELKARCRAKGVPAETLDRVFHGWGGLMKEMCLRGMIAYAPGTKKHFHPCSAVERPERDAARREILRRYFTHLGPATLADCAVFTGMTKKTLRELLDRHPLPLRSLKCDGEEYFYIRRWDGGATVPRCLFLAGFDQLLLAYKDRSRLVPDAHRNKVVTNTGIIHPTLLVDGMVRAKWKLAGGTLTVTPFETLSAKRRKVIKDEAKRLFGGESAETVFAG